MDTCIKAGSYCPVCKGVVGRDCWHDASEFKRGANYAEEFFAAKDEIESLRQQLASAQEELHFQACLTRDLLPYQERAIKSEQQLAAALAACEVKDAALQEVVDLIGESSGVYGLHLNGDNAPWEEVEQGGRFERLTSLCEALAIQPSAPTLKGETSE